MAARADLKVVCTACRYPNPYWEKVCTLCGGIIGAGKAKPASPAGRKAAAGLASHAAPKAPAPRRAEAWFPDAGGAPAPAPSTAEEPAPTAAHDPDVRDLVDAIRSGSGYYVTCFLYSVPFPIPKDRPLRIGRGPDNDVVLPAELVSRHHAEVRPGDGSPLLADLGSRNGTYVGTKKVSETAVTDGDRFRVGPFVLSVRRHVPGETRRIRKDSKALLEKETVDAGFFDPVTALEGNLAQMAPRDVLRVLADSRKTGVLEIRGGDGAARVYFIEGSARHAEVGTQKGAAALRAILSLRSGDFHFATAMFKCAKSLEPGFLADVLGEPGS